MLKKFLTLTFVVITCSISIHAITIEDFITKCDTIIETPAIKLSGDEVQELKNENVDTAIIFVVDTINNDTKHAIDYNINLITKTDDMLVVKHNEDDTAVQVYIQPRNEKMEMLVTVFDSKECVIIYMIGGIELLQQDNIIKIGGKDLIKEALKKQEQKE